jgi:Lon protease-like protein
VSDPFDVQPLFPLPNVVLFPKAILPLHVFEPRYRTMMAEVLKGGQTICMALLKPGWESDYEGTPAVHGVACVGRVVQHQHLPDDRYNIMIHGEMKVAIDGMEQEYPYRVARVRPLTEDLAWTDGPRIQEQLTDLLTLFRKVNQGQGAAIELAQVFGAHLSAEAILNSVAMNLNVEPIVKQRLLDMERTELRYRAVIEYLRDSASTQDVIDRVRHLYPEDRRQN